MRCFNLLFGFSLLLLVSLAKINEAVSVSDNVYIVYMGGKTSLVDGAPRNDHTQLLSELMERKKDSVLQIYSKSFLGFAARLTEAEVKSTTERPGVVSIFPDQVYQLHTTRSWDFLKSSSQNAAFHKNYEYGSTSKFSGGDTIIGILDTGIWPEHESFNDKKMGPIPQRWKGECMSGGENSTSSFECNKKLVGARYYDDPLARGSIITPRDFNGHGTLVASVAAGRPIRGASYYGLARGVATGGSPGSRIAVYRVCGTKGCSGSSTLKAFDDAIADGVDVLSISMGGNHRDPLTDSIGIGAFHAAEKGIVVVCSVGNSGPSSGTAVNVAPWIVTVGATTIDRDFEVDIVLGHDKAMVKGGGMTLIGLNKSAAYTLVDGRSDNNASSFEGKIVVCDTVNQCLKFIGGQGAMGAILIGDYWRQSVIDFGLYTVAAVSDKDGARVLSYINSTSNPLATILPTRVIPKNYKPSPAVAIFSSRGPATRIKNILKPDVTAPGVGILGAWRLNSTSLYIPGKEPPLFNVLSGTSFSCPHVSGLVAKLKSRHPTWSPSAIRSSIMTTAIQQNNLHTQITTFNGSRANPYDIGAGEINLFGPFYPGLVYETEITDYVQFLCNTGYNASVIRSIASSVLSNFSCPSDSSPDLISDMNYPAIAVSGLKVNGTRTVKRTVTNVGNEYSSYTALVEAPAGMQVQVVPNKLRFNKNVKKMTFQVTFILLTTTPDQEHLFGSITWFSWTHEVRSPFVVTIN